jgi:hypothetical protein
MRDHPNPDRDAGRSSASEETLAPESRKIIFSIDASLKKPTQLRGLRVDT